MEVDFSLPSSRVIRTLEQIIEWRGKPLAIRCDNAPEYISTKLLSWAKSQGIRLDHIQPGKPQQNAYIEFYNRTVRHDWLNQELFSSLSDVQSRRVGGCGTIIMNVRIWLWAALRQSNGNAPKLHKTKMTLAKYHRKHVVNGRYS